MIKYDRDGLFPAIISDYQTQEVLMLGYMNAISYGKSCATGQTWFYSRSRQELWHKGATSGHYQNIKSMHFDCDHDTLLVCVEQVGGIACHTGTRSCFFNEVEFDGDGTKNRSEQEQMTTKVNVLTDLMVAIEHRKKRPQGDSYTNYLLSEGIDKIGKKIAEEAMEVVLAAKNKDEIEIINEASDLLYHLMVLLANSGVSYGCVEEELQMRTAKIGNLKIKNVKGAL
ncbi:phosphoribosyl-AMP cyclohydrolase/phosphoribosyl-ATP pyrophosphatase [Erysipelotrichaceae bacterium]|nr:phosphoribosyl-AMP cyclohydrolase/phosphoribosyl-ATP pyrophosphatase [Erysipelotrichaceae bacterium]